MSCARGKDQLVNKLCFRDSFSFGSRLRWTRVRSLQVLPRPHSWLVIHPSSIRTQVFFVAALQIKHCLATLQKFMLYTFCRLYLHKFQFSTSYKSPSIWKKRKICLLIECVFNLSIFLFSRIVLCSVLLLLFDCRNGRAFFVIPRECLYLNCLCFGVFRSWLCLFCL